MSKRGWVAVGLTLVAEDDRLWTVAEAARLLDRSPDDVRWLIRSLEIPPVGRQKKSGSERRGRQPRVYRAIDLIKAYDVLSKAA